MGTGKKRETRRGDMRKRDYAGRGRNRRYARKRVGEGVMVMRKQGTQMGGKTASDIRAVVRRMKQRGRHRTRGIYTERET